MKSYYDIWYEIFKKVRAAAPTSEADDDFRAEVSPDELPQYEYEDICARFAKEWGVDITEECKEAQRVGSLGWWVDDLDGMLQHVPGADTAVAAAHDACDDEHRIGDEFVCFRQDEKGEQVETKKLILGWVEDD
jgi:hypothetical protein